MGGYKPTTGPIFASGTADDIAAWESLANDARYRWLRDGSQHAPDDPFIARRHNGMFSRWTGPEADRVIDEAMNAAFNATAPAALVDDAAIERAQIAWMRELPGAVPGDSTDFDNGMRAALVAALSAKGDV